MKDILLPILIGVCIWAAVGGIACLFYAAFSGKWRDAEIGEEGEA